MAVKRGKKWQANVRFDGKFHRPTFSTKEDAEEWEKLARQARDEGLPIPPADGSLSVNGKMLKPFIDEVFEDLWGGNKSARQYRFYTDELVSFFGGDKPLKDITTAEYDRFMAHCRDIKGNSDKTLNRKTSVLSKLLRKAKSHEHIERLPEMTRRREGKGRKRYLQDAEEKSLIDTLWSIGEYQASMRCQFMIYTGARDGEVRALQWSDIDGKHVTLEGKTGHRTLVMPKKAQEAIIWSKSQGHEKPFPMAYETFKEAWDKAACRLGYGNDPGWIPYIMRHTCASRLVKRGVDIRRVKDWMGHTTIQTTMVYAHLAPQDLEVCAGALDE